MPRIEVGLPTDRTLPGNIRLVDDNGNVLAGPFLAYGKADGQTATNHGNPTRNPTQPFGDTPLGAYTVGGIRPSGPGTPYNSTSYGNQGVVAMTPTGGQAATAAANGRTGLLIHGGDLGPNGGLRPTNGCVRVSNRTMGRLIQAISQFGAPNRCEMNPQIGIVIVDENFSVDIDTGEELGDPPPVAAPAPLPGPAPQPPPAPHSLAPHDRDPHDAEPHDREPHSLEPHSLEPHSLEPHSLEPHSLEPHDLEPHSRMG